jgi:hypothetical protein
MAKHTEADVLHIGYPKAASTFIGRFLASHPEVTTDHNRLANLLLVKSTRDNFVLIEKPCADKIHVSRDESVAESVCVIGELDNWRRYLYIPGAWNRVKADIIVDPAEAATRLQKVHSRAKVLLLIREQADWLQSAYKFSMSQLPGAQRSFADYCATPSGIVLLQAGHFDRTIEAYVDVFGRNRVRVLRFEDIVSAPKRFAADLCSFIGVSERPLPQQRENDTHAQIVKIQRLFPIIERLPRSVKSALKSYAARLLPGARSPILPSSDIRILRSMYVLSNQRTDKLIQQLSTSE